MEKKDKNKKSAAEKKKTAEKPKKTVALKKETEKKEMGEVEEKKETKTKEKKERAHHQATAERKKRARLQKKIAKKKHPSFRGRFGTPKKRRKSMEKWQKWRMPRGIDIVMHQARGFAPDSGYRTAREIRGLHPSGMREKTIATMQELGALTPAIAIRIQAAVGKKKRRAIIAEAAKKGFRILN